MIDNEKKLIQAKHRLHQAENRNCIKECTFKAVDGVLLDEFVVAQLSNLSDESAVYYNTIFNEKLQNLIANDETETECRETKKAIEKTKTAIAAQVRNMREADEALRKFIEADIAEMNKTLKSSKKTFPVFRRARQTVP